ncbi:DNA binding [Zea mays]|uniref:DNA binding n=1 Tax=Zea mays TaxID=4577 RepID=A0A1D6ELM2_MAIZE|nr:DNA binding [Zea mays]
MLRITALDACGNYGYAGTHGGLLYLWELSSGRKVTGTQCFNSGRVSCVSVDSKSGAVAVTDGGCHVLLYTQDKVQAADDGADGRIPV